MDSQVVLWPLPEVGKQWHRQEALSPSQEEGKHMLE